MKCQIEKWGHSLAIRIRQSIASEVGLEANIIVDITLVNSKWGVTVPNARPALETLLAGVTPDNCHPETNW